MARDYFDESKNKKKKKETTQVQKVAKSPSVQKVNKTASKSTFMGGGSAVKNTAKNTTASRTQSSGTQRTQTVRRQPTTATTQNRLTAAQRQKMGLNDQLTASERQSWRERSQQRAAQARTKKMGLAPEDQPTAAQKEAANRALKNTPSLIGKALKDTGSGYLQTLNDVTARTASNPNATKAQAMKMGIEEGTKQYQQIEENRQKTLAKAKQDNQSLYEKMKSRQAEWDEKTKDAKGLEKAYYGAVESGTGMLADTVVGTLTGTGQVGALASMGLRTYGSSANQARAEGATDAEAGWYGLAQAAKEMGTEAIGGGGLAKVAYGKGALGLGDLATNTLIRNLKGQKADLAHMGVRLLGDVAEENIEEAAGWTLDPWIKELTYGRNARERDAQTAMRDKSNALRAEIQNEDDARAAAAYLSSDDFIEQTMQDYIAAGLKEKEAAEVAERMRDYLTASLTGDTDSMQKIEDEVSNKVAKSHNVLKDYSFKELKETFEATSLLVAATGLPANISTMNRGNLVKDQLGDEGVRALASTAIDFEDSTMSTKAQAMKARLDEGKELTGTQTYELMSGMQEQVRKDTEREQSSRRMAAKAIENDNLLTPYRQNQNGGIDLDEFTEASYRENANKAGAAIDALTKESKESITDTQKVDGSKAIAGFQTGVFTVDDANALNYSNTTVRAAFENVTGVNLGQYIVRKKNGEVDIPATNTKTKDALFAMAADNLVKTAQAETNNWMDNAKGQVVTQVTARMGATGSDALQQALDDVDERDRSKYMMTANATDMLYQAARNMGTAWETVSKEATSMFPGISESKLKMMYEAGLADRDMANDKARGRQIRMGEALSEMGEQQTATGKVFIDTEVPPKGTVIRTFTEIAKNLGADIHFVDYIYDANGDPIKGANGSYDPKTNTFYLNVSTGIETNIGYIFMHETTHYIKRFAPEQYQALENLVRERWFAFDPSQMQDAIARKIEAYKRVTKGQQVLTEEEALEEIIADAAHDFINDPEFAKQVAEEDMGLAKAVLDSIRNALRMLRSIFASGTIDDETHMNSLFRELDILAEAERLWLDAYKVAVQNSSIAAVNTWQDNANKQSEQRLSVSDEELERIKAKKRTNAKDREILRDAGEKLKENDFYSLYSAHKLDLRGKGNIAEQVENIKANGFMGDAGFGHNVIPSVSSNVSRVTVDERRAELEKFGLSEEQIDESINSLRENPGAGVWADENTYIPSINATQLRYAGKKGETVLLVPEHHVYKGERVINGFKPFDYEVVEVEYDYQPYYELYSKAYDDAQNTTYSLSDAPSMEELDGSNSILESDNGEPVAKFDEDGAVRFSISSYEAEGRKVYKNYLDKLVNDGELSQKEADDMLRELETIYGISKNLADSGKYAPFTAWSEATVVRDSKGKPVFSAIKKNSEYKMNIDFSTICKKRRTLDAVFREMINRGLFEQLDLNKDESAALVVNINNLIRQHKFEAACALCFVEARRYRQQQTAKTFTDMWNGLVESMYKDKSKIAYFNFGEDSTVEDVADGIHTMDEADLDLTYIKKVANAKKNGKPVQTAEAKAARLMLNDPEQRKLMRVGDMMASTGFENMQVNNPELMKVYNSKKGTGGAKSSFGDVQYLNEIIRSKTFSRLKAYDVSGVRIQSFSDYVPRMVFDYVQVIADLAAKKLPAHAYTKEVLFARQFGLTGAKINLSLVPDVVADSDIPGLDKDGNYVWNKEGTFPYDEAMKLQKAEGYKDNCGTIAVGISDEQIWKMLADPTIQMVIPYHKSSLNPIVAAMTNVDRFTDYTDFQNTKDAEGKTVKKDFAWDRKLFRLTHDAKGNLLPKEKWGNVQDLVKEYAEWCESKNYTPKFSKFLYMEDGSINPGYYKLLEDFALLDNDGNFKPQGDVQMRFPTSESAFGSMEDLIKQGLSEDTALEAKRSEEISGIVDEIEGMMQEGTLTEQSATSEKLAQRLSISEDMDDAYMDAVNSGNMDEAQRLVDEAAKMAGYTEHVYHGTGANFTVFDINKSGNNHGGYSMFGKGFYFSDSEAVANAWGKDRKLMHTFIKLENPYIVSEEISEGALFDAMTELRDKWGLPKKSELDAVLAFETLNEQYGYDYTTNLLKEAGYDGVVYTHPKSSGRKAGTKEYIVFDAESIKSADPITYDRVNEDGRWNKRIIPLSERFDPTNNDIRYSLPTQDTDGNILTDGQMEYFKNSQARDIFGRLVPVYHATDQGGFTIFDPMRSNDYRSLFFSSRRDAANTYVEDKYLTDEDRLGNDENNGGQTGYYQVYLNLENPLIIEGYGQPWNNIVDGGSVFPAYSSITLRNRSWFEDEAESRDKMYKLGQSLYNGDNARARAQEFEGDDYVEIEIFNGKKKIKAIIPLTEEAVAEEAAAAFGVDDLELLQGVASEIVGDMEFGNTTKIYDDDMRNTIGEYGYNTREWAEFAEDEGYDGVIFRNIIDIDDKTEMFDSEEEAVSDIYVAFSSNQVKDTRNENPTENPDIRYSFADDEESKSRIAYDDAMDNSYELLTYYEQQLGKVNPETYDVTKAFKEEDVVKFLDALKAEDAVPSNDAKFEEDRVRRARSKEDFFNNVNAKWNDRWTTEGEVLKISSVKRDITNLVKGAMANSDSDAQYRNEIVKKTLLDARLAYQLMKQDRTELASYLLYHSAQRMIDGLEFIKDDTAFQEYKEIRDFMRQYRIEVPDKYWEDPTFLDFRKEYFGRLRIAKGGKRGNIEDIYKDLSDNWPHLFSESQREKNGLKEQDDDLLYHIGSVIDSNVTPFMEAYSSEEATSFAFDLADQLYEIIANGERVVSLADSYKERFDAKTKAMKARHYEAILRERKIREEGIKKERQKFREYKERQKERQAHTIEFERIKKKYDELTKRLLTNTKDKHIPEQYKKELAGLLKAFDFQTVRSKEREARTGYKAKNTIKLEAMRTALEGIEANSQLFHINDSVTDIMKDLLGLDDASANKQSIEGKTLDELSASELAKVDKLLGALLHEFNNYEKVRVGVKKQQAADIGHAQNNISLEHAELFGAGKDYQNTPGWVDKILNLDEMTAAYLFKRIDPNKEGLGLMYGEIRKSFDKYVRNQNQLNEWMEEIVGKYHNKGILWNKYGSGELTNWRSDNYAQNFKLENGHTIRLTIAQMMSVACLANRKQAYDHMIGNGVVVSPVTFNAKILSDLKKKVNKALPERLTDADIKNIVTALTPEQRQVANKLQELMATKMAEWGNEASMNVIGIRLFEDPDYFPIRSDRGGLTKDLDPNQFEQAIRNFGFTKAVQPGAKNAIMIDDIFDVVTEHCNNMNLYNSYTEAMNDFMKVYNYREAREEGEYTVEQALSHAFSQKAPTFIMQFMRDLNGNVSKRASGIEDAYNSLLGNAKKSAVFANLRVAAQQPTAITRAFAVIDPKYIKGIKIEKGAMEEMFEHCPIALWKSWGYYDINMGKSIEDIMMNNGRWLEDKATDLYGALDNVTWTAIWQMVKAEMKDTHPDVEIGTDEYWDLCNERMSEVVDLTQVVDSPMHRSHAMRDKGFLKKTATAFMAEPTLTFNMIRDGWVSAKEALIKGDKAKASQIAGRTIGVALFQAATVAGAAAIVDALRKKNPDKDDDEDGFLHLWWVNSLENFKSELQLWNKIYFIKDIASIFEGWDNANLALQGIQKFALGYRQLTGDPYARSNAAWYENMADGIGYMWGIPVKTMRTGLSNAMQALGLSSPALEATAEKLDSLAKDPKSDDAETSGFFGMLLSDSDGMFGKLLTTSTKSEAEESEESYDGNVPTRESLPDNLTDEQKDEIIKSAEKRAKKATPAEKQEQLDYDKMLYDALKSASGLEGEEYNKKVYSSVANGLKGYIADGDYTSIGMMRTVIEEAGGDTAYFDKRVLEETRTAYKKSLAFDPSLEERNNMKAMYRYMMSHGMTQEELSSEILYKSDLAKDMKVAYRLNDNNMIYESMVPLVDAGMTEADFQKLYDNKNRMDISKYDGRYKDKLKSTGTFIWPTNGQITSYFGYRNAPTAGASSNHPAIDIGAPMGSDVVAADGGVVIYVGQNGGYGKSVGIKHDNGMVTYYNHLSSWDVNEGDTVAQGQHIANVGSTGISTGPHLDFKVLDTNGEPVDPLKYLQNKRS